VTGRVEIRTAVPADAHAIARVHATSWRETYAGILPEQFIASRSAEQRALAWQRILAGASHSTQVFVAESDAEVVGFGACGAQRTDSLQHRGYDAEISGIYFLQLAQRQGLGRRLMWIMAADLRTRGFTGVALWVLRDNIQARHFYESRGGVVVAEKIDDRGEGLILCEVAYGWPDLSLLIEIAEGFP
jgi:ribosomal protein S18 acetylase RimI-like enzyme